MRMRNGLVALLIAASMATARAQDTADERAAFAPCAACHSVDGADGLGPTLCGIVGRRAGSVYGFRYSRALKRPGLVWDEATLDAFIADPQRVVPGNGMPYSGMTDATQRAAVVDYLRKHSSPPAR